LLIEVSATTFPMLRLPEWTATFVTVMLMIGFPVALIFAWAFELTPEGIKKEKEVDRSQSTAHVTGRKPDYLIIAVLPLANLADHSMAYLSDGITEALITDLAKHTDLAVISRTSVMQYRDTTKSLPQIARELGADVIVEGTVLLVGENLRVSAQLIRAHSDEHIWAESYDRVIANVLALQEEIARTIAGEIDRELGREITERSIRQQVVLPQAYLLNLKGRQRLHQRTLESFLEAKKIFQQSINQDPTYASAYAGLADSYCMLANYGYQSPGELAELARAAADKALQLDSASIGGHRIKALIKWQFDFDWPAAIEEYEKAISLNTNSSSAKYWFGICLGARGEFERSKLLLDEAHQINPLATIIPTMQGWLLCAAGRIEEAVSSHRRVLALEPDYFMANAYLGQSLIELEQFDEGIEALKKAVALSGGISRLHGYLGYAYAVAGYQKEAVDELQMLQDRESKTYVSPYFKALVFSGQRNEVATLEALEKAWENRDPLLRDLRTDPSWNRLRNNLKYQSIEIRLKWN
jgi:TolB-like protein